MNSLRRWAVVVSPFVVAGFAVTLAMGGQSELWAQVSAPHTGRVVPVGISEPAPGTFRGGAAAVVVQQPVSIQQVASFESAFVSQLNAAIRNPEAFGARKKIVIDRKIGPDWFDRRAVVYDMAAPNIQTLSRVQLQNLRDSVVRGIDDAVRLEIAGKPGLRSLGYAIVNEDNTVTGKLSTLPRTLTTTLPEN